MLFKANKGGFMPQFGDNGNPASREEISALIESFIPKRNLGTKNRTLFLNPSRVILGLIENGALTTRHGLTAAITEHMREILNIEINALAEKGLIRQIRSDAAYELTTLGKEEIRKLLMLTL